MITIAGAKAPAPTPKGTFEMKTTAGGLIHVRVGSFPIGLWYDTVEREGVFAQPFDQPGQVIGRLVDYGVKAPEAVHRAIMAALSAPDGELSRTPQELTDWYRAVNAREADAE